MSFLDELKALYKGNEWKAQKRKENTAERRKKHADRIVKFLLSEFRRSAKDGYDYYSISAPDMPFEYEDGSLNDALNILREDYDIIVRYGSLTYIFRGWGGDPFSAKEDV